jgi:hypothetical protein
MEMILLIDARLKSTTIEAAPAEPIIEFKLNEFQQEDLSLLIKRVSTFRAVIDGIAKNENDFYYDEKTKFRYRSLRCTFAELPEYDLFLFVIRIIYHMKKENRTIKYEDKSFMTYNKGEWHSVEFIQLIKFVFIKIHDCFLEYDIELPQSLIDNFKITYDEDEDEIMEPLKKYNLMLRYFFTDPEFERMSRHPVRVEQII